MAEDPVGRACPVVVRQRNDCKWELLAFEHPLAGFQVIKGRIDPGETPESAALRELLEESGLVASQEARLLFTTNELPNTGIWHFFLCDVRGVLPETWEFLTLDDGGQCFRFFWHPIDMPLSSEWHPLFHDVLERLLPRLKTQLKLL